MASPSALLVLTTCTAAEADGLARGLVEDRLAACVSAVPKIASTYRWQGRIEQGEESLLLIKTTESMYAALERAIRERSSYDVPEVLAVRVERGSADYLSWLAGNLGEPGAAA